MKIIGITACLTEIAHICMAQECLERECRKRGFDVRIETQGGLEVENELNEEDAAQTDVVALVVSTVIEGKGRPENKHVLHADVDGAISHVEKLVDRAVALVEGN